MVQIGEGAGRRTVALVTAMDNPLGRTVGNALEVEEALRALAGEGDQELLEVCVEVAGEMCRLAEVEADAATKLRGGEGRDKLEAMLRAQGGRLDEGLPQAPYEATVGAAGAGWVAAIDALEIGLACLEVGVGRRRKEDAVDPAAGLVVEAPVGTRVERGDPLALVRARSLEVAESVVARLQAAWKLSDQPVTRTPHVVARVDRNGVTSRIAQQRG
jgi:thymidine phosphorylase